MEIIEMNVEVKKVKKAWAVSTNTDCNEGRGYDYTFAVCEAKATAIRRGKGTYIQGSNCPIHEVEVYLINNRWYIPMDPVSPTKEDSAQELILQAEEVKRQKVKAALEKAKELGLSDEELALLGYK
jgi:hypothetical protein